LRQKNQNVRVVVEGCRNTCRETERGTTVAAAWPEARRHGGRGLAWISRRKSRRENARQRRLACSRAHVVFSTVWQWWRSEMEEEQSRDGGRNCRGCAREEWRREMEELRARGRKGLQLWALIKHMASVQYRTEAYNHFWPRVPTTQGI